MDTIGFNLIEIAQQNNGEPVHEIVKQSSKIRGLKKICNIQHFVCNMPESVF